MNEEAKHAKCKTKFHHAGVEALRSLRKAAVFETQKLTKRLRQARDGGEDEIRVARLVRELEAVKSLELEPVATYYLTYAIPRRHRELADLLELDRCESICAPHRDATEEVRNVVARLLGSKTFKDSITSTINALLFTAGLAPVKKPTGTITARSKSEKVSQALPFHEFEAEDQDVSSESDDGEHDSQDDEDDVAETRPSRQRINVAVKDSLFLPSLSSGYLPNVDGSSDDEGELKTLFPAQKKERKNRRGQRARRKILEAKHGKNANHILKERQAAQEEYLARLARREAKEAARTGGNSVALSEEAEKNRRERREAALRPIHSSWKAAKMKKEVEKSAKPIGQKIVFDD